MNNYIYIAVMAAVSYTIRVLPLTLIRKPIKNQFIQSFLYYVPYVTLAVMTFPAIIHATQTPISGLVALIAGIIAAWLGAGLFPVSVICCVLVFVIELFVSYPVIKYAIEKAFFPMAYYFTNHIFLTFPVRIPDPANG